MMSSCKLHLCLIIFCLPTVEGHISVTHECNLDPGINMHQITQATVVVGGLGQMWVFVVIVFIRFHSFIYSFKWER